MLELLFPLGFSFLDIHPLTYFYIQSGIGLVYIDALLLALKDE